MPYGLQWEAGMDAENKSFFLLREGFAELVSWTRSAGHLPTEEEMEAELFWQENQQDLFISWR